MIPSALSVLNYRLEVIYFLSLSLSSVDQSSIGDLLLFLIGALIGRAKSMPFQFRVLHTL